METAIERDRKNGRVGAALLACVCVAALTGSAGAQPAPPAPGAPPAEEAPAPAPPPASSSTPAELAPAEAPSAAPAPARPEPAAPATVSTGRPTESPRLPVRVGPDGFALESADRAFVLKIRGYLQGDARFFIDAGDSGPAHTFVVRRARPIFEGTVFRYFAFRLMPDFGGGTATVQDAHVDARPLRELSFRVGKFKAPFGIERLVSAPNLLFVERAFPTLLAPNRELGAQVYGELWDGALSYAVGVFNGVPDGGSTDGDTDEGKDVIGRVFAHPFRPLGIPVLRDLGLGLAGSWGRARGTLEAPSLPSFKSSGQQTFFRYLAGDTIDVTAIAGGERYRLSPQLYYFFGPFGLLGEYVASFQDITLGATTTGLANHAWQAAGTFVIGGDASYEGVRPDRPVGAGGAGAFELAGRYHELRVDPDAFPTFADPGRSARLARGFTVGVGWWANRSFRVMADFDRTTFEGGASGGGDRRPENAVLLRTQVAW